jgi:intracellular sulfur oxidation DsrE/DsrF family protein
MSTIRRTLAAGTFAAAAIVLTAFAVHSGSRAASAATTQQPPDRWLAGLTGKHRQFFDAPAPAGGIPLVHVMNYYDTYNKAYGVKDSDIDAVLTFYGSTTLYGINDAAWAKYKIGEFLETKDASGQFATSIETLQKRGATMILCNNALTIFSGMLAQRRGLDAKVVYDDLKANILPGVELIPGMVVAVEQAHKAGLAYHRQ